MLYTKKMKTLTTLIVADDHPIFLEGLVMLFDRLESVKLLGTAIDGDQTLNMIETYQPDIALIDLSMPGATTEQIIAFVEKNMLTTQLIALTMLKDGHKAEQLLALGLWSYVLKDMAFEDLLNSIRQVRFGKKFISPALLEEMSKDSQSLIAEKPYLTERETEVLMCVAQGDSNKQIAYKLGISQRTVCFHMTNCFIKIDAINRTDAIIKAVNYGLINIR